MSTFRPCHEKTNNVILDNSDTNQAVQAQKMARGWKFCILKVEELYYPCSENKGTDQVYSYCTADLRLCFCICIISCGTSLHYVPLRTLMVLFDQNNFRLNKTGLHMVDTWSVHPNLTLLASRVCLDVTVRALSREHGELLSDWLSVA